MLKGGVGTASTMLPSGVTVGALVVVNAAGEVVDPTTGLPWMADLIADFALTAPPAQEIDALAQLPSASGALSSPLNTTIAVVATDAALSPAGCRLVAVAAPRRPGPNHPAGTHPLDGDTVFALATGAVEVAPSVGEKPPPAAFSPETGLIAQVGAAAADCLARAVLSGVFAARSVAGIPAYRDLLPGAFA